MKFSNYLAPWIRYTYLEKCKICRTSKQALKQLKFIACNNPHISYSEATSNLLQKNWNGGSLVFRTNNNSNM